MKEKSQTYRPRNSKTFLLAIVSLSFAIIGTFMLDEEPVMGWFIISFFGLGVLVFAIQLIPGSAELKLTERGFTITNLFKSHFTKWSDVKSFREGYLGPNKAVLFDYTDTHTKHQVGKLIAKELSGNHGALPSKYGFKTSELVKIMNDWKNNFDS